MCLRYEHKFKSKQAKGYAGIALGTTSNQPLNKRWALAMKVLKSQKALTKEMIKMMPAKVTLSVSRHTMQVETLKKRCIIVTDQYENVNNFVFKKVLILFS